MKGLMLKADWDPKPGYQLTEHEIKTREVITSSSVWRNPKIVLEDVPKPAIGPEDVLLRVKACGICGTDVHLYEADKDGYVLYPGLARFPSVLGHEFSGVVEEVGKKVTSLKPGDKVTVEEMNWCGACTPCRNGFPNQCANLVEIGITINGGFEDYLSVNSKYCWKLNSLENVFDNEEQIFEAGALVEPTCVAYNAMFERGGGFRPGAYVVIYGAGPIGLAATALARCAGAAKVIVFEVLKNRQQMARQLGADHVFDPIKLQKDGSSPHQVVMDLTEGEGADFHFEAAGLPDKTMPEIEKSLAINGRIVQASRSPERTGLYLEVLQVRRGQLFGAQGHSGHGNFPNVIRLMASGRIDMTKIITARFTLDQAVEAFKQAGKRQDGKIIIKP
jgi:hypothetical protein